MNDVPSAPLVLISPAMAIGSRYYRPLEQAFEERGWQARALGRRGFEPGQPRASRRHDWSYDDEIADVAHAVAQARAERPERPVLLMGHSLGGQIVAGHEAGHGRSDGVIMVGAGLPEHRHYRYGGLPLLLMARGIVPLTTALFGHLPKPAFGAPGARTLMREWARMVASGRPPFAVAGPLQTPALFISLEGDDLSPIGTVTALADLWEGGRVEHWHRRHEEVPAGASNDHIGWARTPEPIVERVVAWWLGAEQSTEPRGAAPA